MRKKVVVLLSRFPYPLDKGDKLRAYHQIKYISKSHDVYLHTLTDEKVLDSSIGEMQPYCKLIEIYPLRKWEILTQTMFCFFTGKPVQVGYFYSPHYAKKFMESVDIIKPDVVYCQLSRTALYVKNLPFKKVIDFQDAFSMNYDRIQKNSSWLKKVFYRRESKCMKIFEMKMAEWFNECTIISAFDKDQIQMTSNNLHVVPNGVDTNHFVRNEGILPTTDILFSGNLSYSPNKNAVKYLTEKIAPKLFEKKPDISISIVGSSGDMLKKYETKNIHIHGWINDIREAYNGTRIFVAPLFTGAGLQNKLIEAMSMGIPCITTSIVNASLQGTVNQHLLIADDADEFVAKIILLLGDNSMQQKLKLNGRKFVEENYSWDNANEKLVQLF